MYPPLHGITYLFQMREQNKTIEAKIERFKEEIKNLKSKSAKLKEFIDKEFRKLHKERDMGLYDLIEDMRKQWNKDRLRRKEVK